MKAGVEWLSDEIGIVRCGAEFSEFGDPFDLAFTIKRTGDECEIKGLAANKLSSAAACAIREALLEQGIKRATWERKKTGKIVVAKGSP